MDLYDFVSTYVLKDCVKRIYSEEESEESDASEEYDIVLVGDNHL